MEIREYLRNLSQQYGNDWPKEALERLLQMEAQGATQDIPEYAMLYQWVLDSINRDVASQQRRRATINLALGTQEEPRLERPT